MAGSSRTRSPRTGRSREATARMPRLTPPVARGPSTHRLNDQVGAAGLPCEQVCAPLRGVSYAICLTECRRLAARFA